MFHLQKAQVFISSLKHRSTSNTSVNSWVLSPFLKYCDDSINMYCCFFITESINNTRIGQSPQLQKLVDCNLTLNFTDFQVIPKQKKNHFDTLMVLIICKKSSVTPSICTIAQLEAAPALKCLDLDVILIC